MLNLKIKLFFMTVCLFLLAVGVLAPNVADALSITVKRVTFEGSKRADVITVINNSDKTETYRLSWRHFVMSGTQGLVAVPEDNLPPEVKPSKDMVRFSPRRFTLAPRGSQQVRLMLRMPAGVENGEYRSHLAISPEEDVEAYRDQISKTRGNKTGVFMKMLAGASMPIIVRKGNLGATANIQDLSAVSQGDTILTRFALAREGEKSTYGDLDYICNPEGDWYLLKFTRGVSVYAETPLRRITIKIPKKQNKPACTTLAVRYTEVDGFAGEMIGVLAEATTRVQ